MNNKYDFVIVNLKVISKTPRNKRLKMTSKGFFTLEDEHILVPLKRLLYGDGRAKLIRDVNFLLAETYSQIKLLLSSKHLDTTKNVTRTLNTAKFEESDTDERRIVLTEINGIYRELEKSINGFENLKSTYENDKLIVGELELIVEKIKSYMAEIEVKLPDIPDLKPPVLISSNNHFN